jgi:murein L,D-transpeptidase YafK
MRQKGISKLNNPLIIIDRRNYSLLLFNDTVFIKSFRANFGRNVNNPKMLAGDLATPVGNYKICKIDTGTKYYKFFELDYPNVSDAEEALRRGIISQVQYDSLILDYHNNLCPRADTPLGGHIGIQGIGELNYIFRYLPFNYNWTDGSIAISNEAMDELYSVVKKGTKVVIK